MSYRSLDINLLPPELQPGPVVRYAVIINTILIGVTVAFLVVDSFIGWYMLASLKQEVTNKENQISAKAQVVADYNELIAIENHVNSIGRLISLASTDYVDMPVIMDRITKLLPDGVYLDLVTAEKRTVGSSTCNVRITLAASRDDTDLVVDTISSFKADSMLGDCYLRLAAFEERDLGSVLELAGITWRAGGPDLPDFSNSRQFAFEIHSVIAPPVDPGNLAAGVDNSEYFEVFSSDSSESGDTDGRVAGAPTGVTVVEAN